MVIWSAPRSDKFTPSVGSSEFPLDRRILRSWQFCGDGDKNYIFLCVAGGRSPNVKSVSLYKYNRKKKLTRNWPRGKFKF